LWLHSLKVAQLLRSAACLHTNQSRSYLNHLVLPLQCNHHYLRNVKEQRTTDMVPLNHTGYVTSEDTQLRGQAPNTYIGTSQRCILMLIYGTHILKFPVRETVLSV